MTGSTTTLRFYPHAHQPRVTKKADPWAGREGQAAREAGISDRRSFEVLCAIKRTAEEVCDKTIRIATAELARRSGQSPENVPDRLRDLERCGLIARELDPFGRVQIITLKG